MRCCSTIPPQDSDSRSCNWFLEPCTAAVAGITRRNRVSIAHPGGAVVNFIVIVSDTFRYDYLGANGNPWIKTPELDAFSRGAVNFDRCTISSFPTIPTRTDWFTGRYGFPFHGWQPLGPKATVLAQVLREAGYTNQL